jgi:site-specific recombinase XerD
MEATNRPLRKITVPDVMNYIGTLTEAGLSKASIAHHISAVRTFLKYLQALGLVPQSPLDVLKRPRVAITSMNRYLTKDESASLLAGAKQINDTAFLVVGLLLTTGLRVSELASADWRDVFKDPRGNIGLKVTGKGNKTRVVALRANDVWPLLKSYREKRGLSITLSTKDTTPLVVTQEGKRPSTVALWRWVRAAATKAGIEKEVSPHWLRHSYATMLALAGGSPFQIQADLGHSQIETSTRYVHWARGLTDSGSRLIPVKVR